MSHTAAPAYFSKTHNDPASASKTALITGATGGIGRETARALAAQGWRVYLLGRGPAKLQHTVSDIGAAGYFVADLAELHQVKAAAAEIRAQLPTLDLLINNAGAIFTQRRETREGIEMTLALNVLAPHLLVRELLPSLKGSQDPRHLMVASEAHRISRSDFADPQHKGGYSAWPVYADSKLAAILLTREWARRESWLSSQSLHPGIVNSDFNDEGSGLLAALWPAFVRTAGISPQEGAQTSVYLASMPRPKVNGGYWNECQLSRPTPQALDDGLAAKVWDICGGFLRQLQL